MKNSFFDAIPTFLESEHIELMKRKRRRDKFMQYIDIEQARLGNQFSSESTSIQCLLNVKGDQLKILFPFEVEVGDIDCQSFANHYEINIVKEGCECKLVLQPDAYQFIANLNQKTEYSLSTSSTVQFVKFAHEVDINKTEIIIDNENRGHVTVLLPVASTMNKGQIKIGYSQGKNATQDKEQTKG